MSTPILNPNSSSINNSNTNNSSGPSQIHFQLGQILLKCDPTATRLHDFINHVKVFRYNPNENHWENQPCIEGNLFIYRKQQQQQIRTDQRCPSFAFAIINRGQNLIQEILVDMQEQIDKSILFYEIIINNKAEIFSLHFSNENDCQRLHAFINQAIQLLRNLKEQQSRATITSADLQSKPKISTNTYRQQTPINVLRSIFSIE